MMRTIDLTKKTAVVTGSSQGIGLVTAEVLHAAGANVVINYFADSGGVNAGLAQAAVARLGGRAIACAADVRRPQELSAMMNQAQDKFGSLDLLINNAGILRDRSVKKMAITEWTDVIDTNLTGVFQSCQAALPLLSEGGAIVNIASLSAVMGFFGQANYASAKAGVVALTKVLSKELARQNIRVNAIAPGVVETEMGQSIPPENRAAMIANIPLARFAQPREIADVVLFLCSDLSSYMTGQTVHVNGGWWA
jgi:3-oxoacyl-[acyl-carrier protein] reductase